MSTPQDRKYSPSHEWLQIQGDIATVGLTEFALKAIKDIVYLELPPSGRAVEQMKPFGVIESVKAVFDLVSPLPGVVVEVHGAVTDDFSDLNADPYGKGWLIKVKVSSTDTSHLMDAAAYDRHCAEGHHG